MSIEEAAKLYADSIAVYNQALDVESKSSHDHFLARISLDRAKDDKEAAKEQLLIVAAAMRSLVRPLSGQDGPQAEGS